MNLKELFGEEIATKIEEVTKEKGLNLIVDNKEKPEWMPKSRFDEVIGVKNELKTQVGELSNQLEGLKKSAKGNEELTKKIEELQKQNGDWEGRYKDTLIKSQIKILGLKEKAKDSNDLDKFLDTSKLELQEDGTVKGLEEQLKSLKENKAYLFDLEETKPLPSGGVNPPPQPSKTVDEQIQEALAKGKLEEALKLKNSLFMK